MRGACGAADCRRMGCLPGSAISTPRCCSFVRHPIPSEPAPLTPQLLLLHPLFQFVALERPLAFAIRNDFSPVLLPRTGSVYEAGIEGVTFAFKWAPYGGHHYEDGYNAVEFKEVYDCFARDIATVCSFRRGVGGAGERGGRDACTPAAAGSLRLLQPPAHCPARSPFAKAAPTSKTRRRSTLTAACSSTRAPA